MRVLLNHSWLGSRDCRKLNQKGRPDERPLVSGNLLRLVFGLQHAQQGLVLLETIRTKLKMLNDQSKLL